MPSKLDESRKKGLAVIVSEFGMSAASGNGGISTGSTGKWLKRLNKKMSAIFAGVSVIKRILLSAGIQNQEDRKLENKRFV